jgi:hypothetical protein
MSGSARWPLISWNVAAAALAATPEIGPYNVDVIAGGLPLVEQTSPMPASTEWTLQAWVDPRIVPAGVVRVASLSGDRTGPMLLLSDGHIAVGTAAGLVISGDVLPIRCWSLVTATASSGFVSLYVNGARVAGGPAALAPRLRQLEVGGGGFGGRLASVSYRPATVTSSTIRSLAAKLPDASLISFRQSAATWPVQVRQMTGQVTPQQAWTLPHTKALPSAPTTKPAPVMPVLEQRSADAWDVNGWRMAEASSLFGADGSALSRVGASGGTWYAATVPGTALTTLVDRGVYPDPAVGLNNLAIPERLTHQDYWYRTEVDVPNTLAGKRLQLTFNGINYAADVWINGRELGKIKGAFTRGSFDVTGLLTPSQRNAIAVRISPPPHPGIPSEESLTSGVGENGGMMMLDGPTFEATEGWDWIPTVRDRNTGLWQGVELTSTNEVRLGDAQVMTHLPNLNNKLAEISIDVPITNAADHPVTINITAAFDEVRVSKLVTLAPGEAVVRLSPGEFPQLRVHNPKLWWPNNYGAPSLHMLHLTAGDSDSKDVRFGMREVSYEMSLIDHQGELRRVLLNPTSALHAHIVDHRHEAIREVPKGWAYSFADGGEKSLAVSPIAGDEELSPFLVLRVNGIRIAARGGSIGMDDFMKRIGRDRQEPYFKLHRDAHLNIIRNWMGQNTEENFYALADEYGLMVFNDFWESTQDYNIEAEDVPLFLSNARDVIRRYRNHPSIVLWVARNEGVPQPILNEGIEKIVEQEDGTRLYMASSNRIAFQNSGPYNWQPPEEYFTTDAKGFAVELGTPSFPTLESWKRTIPAPDRWPVSDVWAYHDWHQTGNGAVSTFIKAMEDEFGAATNLEDFERKAQMLEYESYRAILEGFNAGLWKTNSARMYWMTQPAWPSSAWQIFSSDYDTHAAFYGAKKASEPLHVQMNLPDYKVIVVNSDPYTAPRLEVRAHVTSLDNRTLADRAVVITANSNGIADAFMLDLAPLLGGGPVLVELTALNDAGVIVSRSMYWQAKQPSDYRALNAMPQVTVHATVRAAPAESAEHAAAIDLVNSEHTAAIETKLTLFDETGRQVLPAYFSDNYVSLLPGETRRIIAHYPADAAHGRITVKLRGWNVRPTAVTMQ